ncbi:MAG: helix-turn-helix transcriptional regulator [Bifidobacteriaceae bacterium]|jgi:DNA-binding Xre family transcriptional regulator|nr:helix-turn-helix transcriptional regulator [Bifidobacteriaceae bacterium]
MNMDINSNKNIYKDKKLVLKTDNVKAYMTLANIKSQRELSFLIGFSVNQVFLLFKRKAIPNGVFLANLCSLLHCKIDDIVEIVDK